MLALQCTRLRQLHHQLPWAIRGFTASDRFQDTQTRDNFGQFPSYVIWPNSPVVAGTTPFMNSSSDFQSSEQGSCCTVRIDAGIITMRTVLKRRHLEGTSSDWQAGVKVKKRRRSFASHVIRGLLHGPKVTRPLPTTCTSSSPRTSG